MRLLPNPRTIRLRLLALCKGALPVLFLAPSLLFFNIIQTLSLVLWLFSAQTFRQFNRWMANLWWGWCDLWGEHLYGIDVQIHGEQLPIAENAVVFCNHQSMADILVIFSLARKKHRLGDLKWFVKDILKYIPGIGWGMLFIDCLFVKRDWAADRDYIHRIFAKFKSQNIPLWLLIFPEGTRFSTDKLLRSHTFAKERGLEPTTHVLLPRSKGFHASLDGLRDHITAVYDLTICYPDGVPTLWQWIKGLVRRVDLFVERFPIAQLPTTENELNAWLFERYHIKDQLIESYLERRTINDRQ